MVVVLTMDFYKEKLDYVRVCHVTSLRDPLLINSIFLYPARVANKLAISIPIISV